MISRPSSSSSARVLRSVTSPNSSKPVSIAPNPAARMTRPFDSRSRVAVSPASFQGRRREMGVSMVPRRMRLVSMAAAARVTQGSTPHTGSQTKKPSQPAVSASRAYSAAVRASPPGKTKPNFIGSTSRILREMTMRWTSLVPSPMVIKRASR